MFRWEGALTPEQTASKGRCLLGAPKTQHLCRYITRSAIAKERLQRNRAGDVVLQLKTPGRHDPYRDVTAGAPATLGRARLPPTAPSQRFHGVLALNTKLRPEIISSAPAWSRAEEWHSQEKWYLCAGETMLNESLHKKGES
jgi:Putative transposase